MGNKFLLELHRSIQEMSKFKFNLIFANTNLIILFYSLTTYILTYNKEAIFFMLICWYYATHGISNPSYIIEDEITDRTLITVIQSKVSITQVLYSRCFLQICIDTIKAIPVFVLLYFIGDFDFSTINKMNLIFILLFILVAIITSYSIGFILSAVSILNQRATSFVSLLNDFILFFAGITVSIPNSLYLQVISVLFPFPFLRNIVEGLLINKMNIFAIFALLFQSVIYGILGYITLNHIVKYSIKRGKIYDL